MTHPRDNPSVAEQVEILDAKIKILEDLCLSNAEAVKLLTTKVDEHIAIMAEYIELKKHLKFSLTLLGYLESIAVWLAKITAAAAIMWAAWKFAVREAVAHLGK